MRTFDQAVSFFMGFDAAMEWRFLDGFRDHLARQVGESGGSLAWPALASRLPVKEGGGCNLEERRIAALFDALREFLDIPPQ
ncbi:hypothetical protein [Thermomonospora umbrina]|uniref:hypothetical protein n=1 Tax=Thermomonospora umbrina TaxID=111806 RepID=UPI000E22DFEA|nr:hypothetical protein [Thermomonospora umbrina]